MFSNSFSDNKSQILDRDDFSDDCGFGIDCVWIRDDDRDGEEKGSGYVQQSTCMKLTAQSCA